MTERFEELGGQPGDRWALPKTIPCPNCHQPVGERCLNEITGLPSRIPCVARRPKAAS